MSRHPLKICDLDDLRNAVNLRNSLRLRNHKPWPGSTRTYLSAAFIYNMNAATVHSLILNGLYIYQPKRPRKLHSNETITSA